MPDWTEHLIEDAAAISAILNRVRRIAVLGIKPASTGAPAYYVPEYVQRAGYEILPVPVYYPEVTEILGIPVVRTLAELAAPVDMVNVFRRPSDIAPHLDDILAAHPSVVWMQSGIRHAAVAEQLAREGIDVVQDRCLLVELSQRNR